MHFQIEKKILIQHKKWSSKLSVKSYSIQRNKGRKENFLLFLEKRTNSYFLKFVPTYWKNSINISDIYFLNVFSHKVYKKYKMGKIEQQREEKSLIYYLFFRGIREIEINFYLSIVLIDVFCVFPVLENIFDRLGGLFNFVGLLSLVRIVEAFNLKVSSFTNEVLRFASNRVLFECIY